MNIRLPRAGPSYIRRVSLLAALLVLPFLVTRPSSAQVAAPPREPLCYTWDFANSTGQDADDLHVVLRSVQHVSSVYEGNDNVFGAPLASSAYDAARDVYRLEYGGGVAPDATPNHLGLCVDSPVLRLVDPKQEAGFYWTTGGRSVDPAPVFVGLTWTRAPSRVLRIMLHNDQDSALTIWSAVLLASEQPLPLNDLGDAALATLPAVMELAPEVLGLDPGASTSFAVPEEALTGLGSEGVLLLSVAFSKTTDEGDAGHLYAQLSMPLRTYLPLILR